MNTLRRIGGWLTPYRGRMTLALVLTTLACLFNLPVPLLVQELVDRVVTQSRWNALAAVCTRCSSASLPCRRC